LRQERFFVAHSVEILGLKFTISLAFTECYTSLLFSEDGFLPQQTEVRLVFDSRRCLSFETQYSASPTPSWLGVERFDTMVAAGRVAIPGMKMIVFSQTLRQEDHPKAVIVGLKPSPGKDIWLFSGGSLFRSLAEDGLVDAVGVRVAPDPSRRGSPFVSGAEEPDQTGADCLRSGRNFARQIDFLLNQ
jgi:hypothetical protein